ncbi:peptide/nickel transport system ATP-binding protein [Paenibacillus sp. UNCCL117]|uniref:ABC transporter ATP-binding protein n=1 Tax=unclassified Paenibacillus TaxID=185978 RepID=UPI00089182BB|nr:MULTISPECIES: ABC transporter ATP-binding protein [unclassified Paenibacillus]SDE14783.1 peptide/nickel transport system ATP-binding protein [Paenibacillus sp. cl123]SFW60697.1 peptide/nickel transport system ATP-binding protein [Paenibacillus sp. UNCCL117]
MALLEVNDLSVAFVQYVRGFRQQQAQVLHGLSLSVDSGEILAVVGASGSGKSLLAHAILGILPVNARARGSLRFRGEELTPERQQALRGSEIALVPQSVQYLDPLMRVGRQVRDAVRTGDPAEAQRSVFERYRLKPGTAALFPFQLSGGMARRVLVSTATVSGARLVVADEPTPGLDPAVVAEALGSFRELADEGCGVMLISHDIESALAVADRVAVLYAGSVVEIARAEEFAGAGEALRHPYTRALWRALPQNGFVPLRGSQPPANALPAGCAFAPRCAYADASCTAERPGERALRGGMVRCIHAS